jgi:hypothetical protein
MSLVRLEIAGMGAQRIRLTNLPPELSGCAIRTALAPYGVIHSIHEIWSKNYPYAVSNGIRIMVTLNKHLSSNINIAGHTALTPYKGQPQTCYGCGETDHMYQVCPKRRGVKPLMTASIGPTGAQLVAAGPSLSDNSEYVTNSAITPAPGHRSVQQSHLACTGTCIGESGPASPSEAPRVQDTP